MVVRLPETKKYLNRDGLEEYNSLLPHSSGEMQEYVNDWLDEHPEATTTVQDGAISEPKLADNSVSLRTLADDTVHMLKGMMLTREISGNVLSADDAYSAPPVSLAINGKSTQDGTPTPENPVPIQSIEVLNLFVTFAGKNFFDKNRTPRGYYAPTTGTFVANNSYVWWSVPVVEGDVVRWNRSWDCTPSYWNDGEVVGHGSQSHSSGYTVPTGVDEVRGYCKTSELDVCIVTLNNPDMSYAPYVTPATAQIPMQGHVLRSLPDGTCDAMTLSYLRPSTREGWAVYSREVVIRTHQATFDGSENWVRLGKQNSTGYYFAINQDRSNPLCSGGLAIQSIPQLWSHYPHDNPYEAAVTDGAVLWRASDWTYNNVRVTMPDGIETVADFKTWLASNNVTVQYILATPVTTQLDPIELPVLPAPTCTVWSDPTTGLQMEYVRDSNIVIQRIEEAIADL